jgi:CheY-like chemotaxis protein
MISVVLGNRGLKVRSLLDGRAEEAHRIAKESDIILMDVVLPGMSGVDIGKLIKSDPGTRHIPIIMISGQVDVDDLTKTCVADAFIKKPFSLSHLLGKIDHLMASGLPALRDV